MLGILFLEHDTPALVERHTKKETVFRSVIGKRMGFLLLLLMCLVSAWRTDTLIHSSRLFGMVSVGLLMDVEDGDWSGW